MKKLLLFLLIGLGFMACRKDLDDVTTTDDLYTPPVIKVNGTVAGQVVDEQGNGIKGAIVHLGNLQRETSTGGFFQFRNAVLNANGTFVKVDQPGYFHSSKRLYPKANATNYTTLTLMARHTVGQIEASAGGTLTLSDGARITLPAGGIVTSNGSTYAGTVNIAARWLNPTASNLNEIMPGDLVGINTERNEVVLATFGMLVVELTSDNGERLNLGNGATAELFSPLPASMQSIAPDEIPLWHFDESTGLWREEGKATKTGNGYAGAVNHFSFWNYDVPYPLVHVQGQIVDGKGTPLPNMAVRIIFPGMNQRRVAYTNDEGIFGGNLPANQMLVLQIIDNCNAMVLEENIESISEDSFLGVYSLSGMGLSFIHVSGVLVNCDGEAVNQGVVRLCGNGEFCPFYNVQSDGSFEFTLNYCESNDLSIIGIDLDEDMESLAQTLNIASDINLGILSVCANPISEYFKITVNGTLHIYPAPLFNGQPGALNYVYVIDPDSTYSASISFPNQAPGTYIGPGVGFNYYIYSPTYMSGNCNNPCNNTTVTVTEFGDVGEYIRGHFEGSVDFYGDNQQVYPALPVSGEFSVRRLQ